MHYYQKNIGDYQKKAGRLSMLQHGAYNQLIDCCYDREKFPTRDEAIDWVWASSKEEIEAVDFVLNKFFVEQEDGTFVQKRIAETIAEYQQFCQKQAEKGKKGGRPKKKPTETQRDKKEKPEKPSGFSEEPDSKPVESPEKPKPLTTNHKPLTNQSNNTGDGGNLIAIDWRPPDWVITRLHQLGLPDDFIEYKITEFITYWIEQEPREDYPNKFFKNANRDWQHQQATWGKPMQTIDLNQIQTDIDRRNAQALSSASKPTQTQHSQNSMHELSERLTQNLWPKLANLYGYKFTSQFGEAAPDDWVRVMSGVTGQQIAHGLQRCLNEYPEWPPGAAQFRALCIDLSIDDEGNEANWQHKRIEAADREHNHQQRLKLTSNADSESTRRKGRATLDQLKKLVAV